MAFRITKIPTEPPAPEPEKFSGITLSLISHTNIGKTTLARTLLRREVGEVGDLPHVTEFAKCYELAEKDGLILRLWDTPGFGDSARLLKRLEQEQSPINWIVTEIWDRFSQRPLWSSQQAVKNVREEADIVLYLINASETPEEAPYVEIEMKILTWIDKPVIILLNQTGNKKSSADEKAEITNWHKVFQNFNIVKKILHLDAFARCWVQEHALLQAIEKIFASEKSSDCAQKAKDFSLLAKVWEKKNWDIFHQSVKIFAEMLAKSALDGVPVAKETFIQKIGIGRQEINAEMKRARDKLRDSLAKRMKKATDEVIKLNGLDGESARVFNEFSEEHFGLPEQVDENLWTAIGGLAAGTTAGLSADLISGGMTFGGGAILGGIGGGTASYLLARSLNLARGSDNRVRWSLSHFKEQFELALLTYLAIAHFGRGRGTWQETDEPQIWQDKLKQLISEDYFNSEIKNLWQYGEKYKLENESAFEKATKASAKLIETTLQKIFNELYPDVRLLES